MIVQIVYRIVKCVVSFRWISAKKKKNKTEPLKMHNFLRIPTEEISTTGFPAPPTSYGHSKAGCTQAIFSGSVLLPKSLAIDCNTWGANCSL